MLKPHSTVLDNLVTVKVQEVRPSFQVPFQVYRGLLCFYSDYFRSAFLGGFTEAKKKSIHLEDVDASTFRIFMGWLHFGNFSDSHGNVGRDLSWDDILKVWVFADNHLIPLLKNEAVDLILDKIAYEAANDKYFPRCFELPYVYDNTAPNPPLRRIFIDAIANYNYKGVVEGSCVECWNAESFRDLSAALFDRPPVAGIGKRNIHSLLAQDRCTYHDHSSDGASHSDHEEPKKRRDRSSCFLD
ncbi:hypothetical protein BDV97DRAFT_313677 [Delphinella strobiligena]|nr:hypothetical protein BDV97DRAFT_313677 [Delphinella strobiligena]